MSSWVGYEKVLCQFARLFLAESIQEENNILPRLTRLTRSLTLKALSELFSITPAHQKFYIRANTTVSLVMW